MMWEFLVKRDDFNSEVRPSKRDVTWASIEFIGNSIKLVLVDY